MTRLSGDRINYLLHFNFAVSLVIVLLLNIIDAFFTIIFVDAIGLQEANPIVAPLFILGPAAFFMWKIFIVTTCCVIIYTSWCVNKKPWVQKFVYALMGVYGILALTHMFVFFKIILMSC